MIWFILDALFTFGLAYLSYAFGWHRGRFYQRKRDYEAFQEHAREAYEALCELEQDIEERKAQQREMERYGIH